MPHTPEDSQLLVEHYNAATGGTARAVIYERSIWEFFHCGFTLDDFKLVLKHIQKYNQTHDCQLSIALGKLLNDKERFNDILSQATAVKARQRSPRDTVLKEFRKVDKADDVRTWKSIGEHIRTATGGVE